MANVRLRAARSRRIDPALAADDLLDQLGTEPPKLVTMFASHDRDHVALNRAVRERLPPKTRLVGATTGGEIDNDGLHAGTVVLSALSGDFDVGLGLGRGLTRDALAAGGAAIERACEELGIRPGDTSPRKHVGLVIDDAFRFKKEELLLGMLEKNQSLALVGGGASDDEPDPAKQSALVHVDGEVVGDAALVALFSTDAPWAALRSHWYLPTGQTLRITKVDPTHTRALEIDGKPAAARYAELLGVTPDDLEFGKPRGFATKPTALRVGREYFIRAPWKPLPDGSILFANLLEENVELELMTLGDMVGCTKRFFEEDIPRRVSSPQAALFFHCSGRKWFAESTGTTEALSSTFRSAPPCAGMNVHFEIYCGFHINTTLTALVFGGTP
jgi:hypothetical protein